MVGSHKFTQEFINYKDKKISGPQRGYLLTVSLALSGVHGKCVTAVCIRILSKFIRRMSHLCMKDFYSDGVVV